MLVSDGEDDVDFVHRFAKGRNRLIRRRSFLLGWTRGWHLGLGSGILRVAGRCACGRSPCGRGCWSGRSRCLRWRAGLRWRRLRLWLLPRGRRRRRQLLPRVLRLNTRRKNTQSGYHEGNITKSHECCNYSRKRPFGSDRLDTNLWSYHECIYARLIGGIEQCEQGKRQ